MTIRTLFFVLFFFAPLLLFGQDTLRFTGGGGGGFSTASANANPCAMNNGTSGNDGYAIGTSPTTCIMNGGSSGNDGYGSGISLAVCVMNVGTGFNDGYGIGTSSTNCVMNVGTGFNDGYGIGRSPDICFFTGVANDGYASARNVADEYCEAVKTPLYVTPCGVRDNGSFCNAFTGEQSALGEPSGQLWALDGTQHTLWFQFSPPSFGTFSIETFNSTFDPQIAVYEADPVTHCPLCQIASAESGGAGNNARLTLSCLDPSKVYYLQLDGNGGSTGTTNIRISETCPTPTYAGTDECNSSVVSAHNVYNLCLSPHTAGSSDPNGSASSAIASAANSQCGLTPDVVWENSTFLPVQFNSTELQIDVVLNQSTCNRGFSVLVFQAPNTNCPAPNEWASATHPLVGCFEGNGTGNVVELQNLTPNTPFFILVDGVQGDGGLLQLNIAPLLPLTWLSFSAERIDGKHHLSWQTGTELNTSHFVVERSADALHFEPIGTQPAAGYSTSRQYYQHVDAMPLYGFNYYRIRQVDSDGAYSYSTIAVLNNLTEQPQGFSLFPNPATDAFTLQAAGTLPEEAYFVEIYDALARRISRQALPNIAQNSQEIGIAQLVAGVYTVCVVSEKRGRIFQQKLEKKDW